MGQYYVIATQEPNTNAIQLIETSSSKMMEHAYMHDATTRNIFTQLLNRPQHVGWIGDYACTEYERDEEGELVPLPAAVLNPTRPALYAGEDGKKRAEFVLGAYNCYWAATDTVRARHIVKFEHEDDEFNPADFVIVNDTKKLYIDCKHQIALYTFTEKICSSVYKSCVNPLAILCDASQEDAGGDYHGANMWASGLWLGDIIRVCKRDEFLAVNRGLAENYLTREQGYEEFSVPFTDSWRVLHEDCLDNLKK